MLLPLLDLVEAAMAVFIGFIVKSQTKKLNFGPKSAIQGFGIQIQFIVGVIYPHSLSVEDTVHPV